MVQNSKVHWICVPVYRQITDIKCSKSYSSKIVSACWVLIYITFFNLENEMVMQYNNDLL